MLCGNFDECGSYLFVVKKEVWLCGGLCLLYDDVSVGVELLIGMLCNLFCLIDDVSEYVFVVVGIGIMLLLLMVYVLYKCGVCY